jgi:serine/threonine protein kinase
MQRRKDTSPLRQSRRPHAPRRIGPYVTQCVLGAGGMGTVYQARHERGGYTVALKVMSISDVTRNRAAERRFEREASAICRIDHPNVIRLLDFGHLHDGTLFYAMEMLQGSVMTRMLQRRRKLSPREALPYVQQICAGLQAAHDQGVIHRDLKPDNIFVVQEAPVHVKVFDFGVAKLLDQSDQLTAAGIMVGTPVYFAPEQAMGESRLISPQTDLYSLGVMLYGTLTGAFPFYSEATVQLVLQHINQPPPPLRQREPAVPQAVADVVEWCLQKDPKDRPSSAMALARAFAAAVDRGVSVDSARRTTELTPPRPSATIQVDELRSEPRANHEIETVLVTPRREAPSEDDKRTVLVAPRPRLATPKGATDRRRTTPKPIAGRVAQPVPPARMEIRRSRRPASPADNPIQTIDLLRVPLEISEEIPPPPLVQSTPRKSWPVYLGFSLALLTVSILVGVALQYIT